MKALVYRFTPWRYVLTRLLGLFSWRAFVGPISGLSYEEIPEPGLPGPRWMKIRTALCGVCGSDVRAVFLRGNSDSPLTPFISFPMVPGHELVGTVEEVGSGVSRFRPGERVALDPWLSCVTRDITPLCPSCQQGNISLCYNFAEGNIPPGVHTGNNRLVGGGFARLLTAHESQCYPIPPEVSFEEAVFADPFSVSLHAVLKHPPLAGEYALVYGCGSLGLLTIIILRSLYPRISVGAIARFDFQKEMAAQCGATTVLDWRPKDHLVEEVARLCGVKVYHPWAGIPILRGGVPIVYDCVGSAESLEVSLRFTRPRGTVVLIGFDIPRRFEWSPIWHKEVSISGSNAFGMEELNGQRLHAIELFFRLLREKHLTVSQLLTHRLPLDQYKEAFGLWLHQDKHKAIKVAFSFLET